MYLQTYLQDKKQNKISFRRVVEVQEALPSLYPSGYSPFKKINLLLFLKKWSRILVIKVLAKIIQKPFYFNDTLFELSSLSPETRQLLLWLQIKGYILGWKFNQHVPGYPALSLFALLPRKVITPSGKKFKIMGAAGNGSGYSLEEAALPAIGEFVERFSSSEWMHRKDLVYASWEELMNQDKPVLNPGKYPLYLGNQLTDYNLRSGDFDPNKKLYWIWSRRVSDRKSLLIPAQMAYTFFVFEHTEEPLLKETNSNGAAAETQFWSAAYKATCELIERDSFLRSWYHQQYVREISLSSITRLFPEQTELIEDLAQAVSDVTFYIIDNDLQIPTIMAISIDHTAEHKVAVTATADVDFMYALKKVIKDITKFSHADLTTVDESFRARAKQAESFIPLVTNFDDRVKLYSIDYMTQHVKWLKDAPKADASTVAYEYEHLCTGGTNIGQKMKRLWSALAEQKQEVYLIDLTGPLAQYAGLRVVRAYAPGLIPLFFDERRRPLALHRFTHDTNNEPRELNPIPHPFL